ncbi:hypothetical protein CH333_00580 [candidate division WOR-3 bacterium JGI_Cruoil_03_44_89]|uniref:Uncharacterized protein n=1 Tax=candidate division WOR-3 bacterium JGI_Cruoil_03_44_89 TaxID=1973748 RepID=A0A235BZE5_UNCW3|nr:MAG: hypothetical protein CH333_00580 [candidate division WOR-3 bacterium JGI_Cruoil_03_44_89]
MSREKFKRELNRDLCPCPPVPTDPYGQAGLAGGYGGALEVYFDRMQKNLTFLNFCGIMSAVCSGINSIPCKIYFG